MNRDEALSLIRTKVKTKNLIKHMLATEAVMKALAIRLGGDEETWGLAGLLHDLDYDMTVDNPERHARQTAEWIEGQVHQEILDAIVGHPGHIARESMMAKALYAVDPLTGLIVAAAAKFPVSSGANPKTGAASRRYCSASSRGVSWVSIPADSRSIAAGRYCLWGWDSWRTFPLASLRTFTSGVSSIGIIGSPQGVTSGYQTVDAVGVGAAAPPAVAGSVRKIMPAAQATKARR